MSCKKNSRAKFEKIANRYARLHLIVSVSSARSILVWFPHLLTQTWYDVLATIYERCCTFLRENLRRNTQHCQGEWGTFCVDSEAIADPNFLCIANTTCPNVICTDCLTVWLPFYSEMEATSNRQYCPRCGYPQQSFSPWPGTAIVWTLRRRAEPRRLLLRQKREKEKVEMEITRGNGKETNKKG